MPPGQNIDDNKNRLIKTYTCIQINTDYDFQMRIRLLLSFDFLSLP